jgi:2-succinyl-6-hydroxy-2,4-cyclohexadiene-1-carboxylate synthase
MSPDAPRPLVLLHGFTGSAGAWESGLLEDLGSDRRLMVVNLPGHGGNHGGSDPQRYQFDSVVDQLASNVGGDAKLPADWVGYSMGARVALGVAVRHPGVVRRLVLESGSPGLETEVERATRRSADSGLARRIEELGIEWFVDHWTALPLFATQQRLPLKVRDRVRRLRLLNDSGELAAALRGMGTGSQPSFWGSLPRVHQPTLLLTGGRDAKFEEIANRMASRLPNATRCTVADAGHAVHLERPKEWLLSVQGFLEQGGVALQGSR